MPMLANLEAMFSPTKMRKLKSHYTEKENKEVSLGRSREERFLVPVVPETQAHASLLNSKRKSPILGVCPTLV